MNGKQSVFVLHNLKVVRFFVSSSTDSVATRVLACGKGMSPSSFALGFCRVLLAAMCALLLGCCRLLCSTYCGAGAVAAVDAASMRRRQLQGAPL